MAAWSFDPGPPFRFDSTLRLVCPFHGGASLAPTNGGVRVFPLNRGGVQKQGQAFDLSVRCPECGYVELFGIALSDAEARLIAGRPAHD